VSRIPSIPELEVLAVQIFLFLMLIFALAGLLVREFYRLKRKWIAERRKTEAAILPLASPRAAASARAPSFVESPR
jgi:hypothetical protein